MHTRNPRQLAQSRQFQVLYAAGIPVVQYPEFNVCEDVVDGNASACLEGWSAPWKGAPVPTHSWWQVSVHGVEIARQQAAAVNTPVLSQQQILNLADQPVSAGVSTVPPAISADPLFAARYSQLKARVTFGDDSAMDRVIDMDIGGATTISLFARKVSVQVCYPNIPGSGSGVIQDPSNPGPGVLGAGTVLDSWIAASIAPTFDAPIGRRIATYSTTRVLTIGTPFLFKVPASAKAVTIYQAPALVPTITAQWFAGNPTAVGPIGNISGMGTFHHWNVPGTARWLEIISPAAGQTVTLVWELEL